MNLPATKASVIEMALAMAMALAASAVSRADALTGLALTDAQTTCKLVDSLGIRIATDFTTRTSGGHTPVFWNEVFRKYAPLLFKE